MRVSKLVLALAASALVFGAASQLSAGGTIQEKTAFASTDSFQTKGFVIDWKFKTGDGSVHPAGQYVLKVRGTGKAGEVGIWVKTPQGKTLGQVAGKYKALGGPDTKGSDRSTKKLDKSPPRFDKYCFSPASQVQVVPQGNDVAIIIDGCLPGKGKASIQVLLPAVK